MTIAKKDAPAKITKHKAAMTTHKKPDSPQAFDIMPRSQVRPDATSRPVITSGKPAVADNTLTTPSTAPQLGKHRILDVAAPPAGGKSQGVSVADLIAKRSEKARQESDPSSAAVDSAPADEDDGGYFLPVEKPKTMPAVPGVEPSADDEPVNKTAEPEVTDDKPDPQEITPTEEPKSTDTEETVSEPAAEAPVIPAEDSVENALKEDEPDKPQTHTQAFKDALKDMKDADASIGDDGRSHHELYGGKPVIVIHKDRGAKSAVSWIVWFVVCVILALLIVNFLLDADVISTNYNVPHSNIL